MLYEAWKTAMFLPCHTEVIPSKFTETEVCQILPEKKYKIKMIGPEKLTRSYLLKKHL